MQAENRPLEGQVSNDSSEPHQWIYNVPPTKHMDPHGETIRRVEGITAVGPILEQYIFLARVRCFALSPDGRYFVAQSVFGRLGLWDAANFEFKRELKVFEEPISFIQWNSSGTMLAAGSRHTNSFKVRIWEFVEGAYKVKTDWEHVWSVCWSPNDSSFCKVSASGLRLTVHDCSAPQTMKELLSVKDKRADCVAWAPDGHTLAVAHSGQLTMYSSDTYKETSSVTIFGPREDNDSRIPLAIVWSPNGTKLSFWCKDLVIWTPLGKKRWMIHQSDTHGNVLSAAWSPDSRLIATGSDTSIIRIWHVRFRTMIKKIDCDKLKGVTEPGVSHLAWSPCGKRLLAVVEQHVLAYDVSELSVQGGENAVAAQ